MAGCTKRALTRRWVGARRLSVAAGVVVLGVVVVVTPATSVTKANAAVSNTTTSAQWSAVILPAGAVATTGPTVVDWSRNKSTSFALVELTNSGTLTFSALSIVVTSVRNSSGSQPLPTITLDQCTGATWTALNSCAGTMRRIAATTGGTVAIALVVDAGARASIRVTSSGPPGANITTTLTALVDRTSIRAGQTLNG